MSSALSYRMWKSVCIGLLCLSCEALCNQERNYGRSVVATPAGVVATSQVAASQAGAQILARGGSAVDAALLRMPFSLLQNP